MQDIAGQHLSVGDTVAISLTGYRLLTTGRIVRFTPKGMKVVFTDPRVRACYPSREQETFRDPQMVAKVPDLGKDLDALERRLLAQGYTLDDLNASNPYSAGVPTS